MRLSRLLTALVVGALLALVTAPVMAATPPAPVHGHMSEGPTEFDDSVTCAAEGITFHSVFSQTIDYTIFYNPDGSQRVIIAHLHQVDTLSANGKTLVENDHWSNFIYPDGHTVSVGTDANIRGDHGIVLHDAGRLIVNGNTVLFEAGQHPQDYGSTFCAALLP